LEDSSSFILLLTTLFLPITLSFKPKLSLFTQILSSLFLILFSINATLEHSNLSFNLHTNIPFLNISFYLDPLAYLFIIIISTLALASSIYSLNYIDEYKNKPLLVFLYTSFISSMILVVSSFNAFLFLIFWEIMSVLSFLLVIFEYKKEENEKAGFIYILMTHLGTAFIILSFLLMFVNTGSFDFKDWIGADLSDTAKFWVFLFALIGFGMKAGIFPLHIWLPKAHPVAPSNVSALMSGVMIKTAIFMLIRFFFDFLGDYQWWFGFTVLTVGSLSALLGVMYALVQHDIKKLLAYHSIENIGIILMGLGLAMIFKTESLPVLASFALLAGLFHTYNHAIFKGLLFLGAGAVVEKTHTRDFELYGGLLKLMPLTGLFFLIGSISISALPPFNGFVSEWLTYQSLLISSKINNQAIEIFTPVFASFLAITGAFAAACFVKVFGISFLGKPRTEKAKGATEAGIFMLTGMGLLAVLCFVFGIFPVQVARFLSETTYSLTGIYISDNISAKGGIILTATDFDFGRISPLILLITGLVIFVISVWKLKLFGNVKTRIYETWACGLDEVNPKAQYSATGFAYAIKRIFAVIYRPEEKIKVLENKDKYFLPEKEYSAKTYDIWELLYGYFTEKLMFGLLWFRKVFQIGIIHVYLAFMLAVLISLLIYVVWF
jgi:hydrogenase-4 component B